MLNNELRKKYIRSFRDGGFVGSYLNELKKVVEQPVSSEGDEILHSQPEQTVPQSEPIVRQSIPIPERNLNIENFIPSVVSNRDSFNPNTITNRIQSKKFDLTPDVIVQSENILSAEQMQKQALVDSELEKRSLNPLEPIVDYIPPPKEPPKSTVPSIDDVKSLQEYVIEKGFSVGKSGADDKLGTNTVKGLQEMLISEGYDLGQKEGYGIDGILGSRTKQALEDYRQKNIPQELEEDGSFQSIQYSSPYHGVKNQQEGFLGECEEEHCSQFVQTEIARNTRQPLKHVQKSAGIVGDAWRIAENIRKKGGTLLYDDYTGVNRVDNVNPGDVITMFTGGRSAYQDIADSELRDRLRKDEIATHTGVVDSSLLEDNNGKYFYVVHNVHQLLNSESKKWQGRKYRDKVYVNNDGSVKTSGSFNFKVKQIVSPAFGDSEKINVNPNIKIEPLENIPTNKVMNTMVKAVNSKDNQKKIMFDLGLTEQEYYDVAQAALGLIGQESKYGDVDKLPIVPGKAELLGKEIGASLYRGAKDLIQKEDSGETSLGYGRIKYNTNFNDIEGRLKNSYGISKSSLSTAIDDGTNSIIATMFALGRRYNELKDKKDVNPEDAMYLAIQRYNRYNLDRPYGKQQKSSKEYAQDRDIDYVNKVLNYSNQFRVTDGEKRYKTQVEDLNRDRRIVEKQLSLQSNR